MTAPHNNNAVTFPHLAWHPERRLVFVFEDIYGILNSNARAQHLFFGSLGLRSSVTQQFGALVSRNSSDALAASAKAALFYWAPKAKRGGLRSSFFYDDIDPNALRNGIVEIDGRLLGDLWARCRQTGFTVVADIHVHPRDFRQSDTDRANPIVAEVGHIAIILPHFAAQATTPRRHRRVRVPWLAPMAGLQL